MMLPWVLKIKYYLLRTTLYGQEEREEEREREREREREKRREEKKK